MTEFPQSKEDMARDAARLRRIEQQLSITGKTKQQIADDLKDVFEAKALAQGSPWFSKNETLAVLQKWATS